MQLRLKPVPTFGFSLLLGVLLPACTSTPTGSLLISVQAEDTISSGLAAGTGDEEITDGWSVAYTKFIVALGQVEVRQGSATPHQVVMNTLVDLQAVGASGRPIQTLMALPTGRYTFVYSTPIADASMTRDASVSAAEQARMVAEGCTYLIQGTATREMRTVAFDFCLGASTTLECAAMQGAEGVVINSGSNSAAMTLHGDHLWFNGFPDGDEGVVVRRAGWLALADDRTGADGMLTNADLIATPVTVLDPATYALTGAPSVDGAPIVNLLQYARAQVATQGHLNGEGECVARAATGSERRSDEARSGVGIRRVHTHTAFVTAIRTLALFALLALTPSCYFTRSPSRPIPVLSFRNPRLAETSAHCLVVFIPGFLDSPDSYLDHGFPQDLIGSDAPCDAIGVDLHFRYYSDVGLADILYEEVLQPATARGYDEIWLVGISMGGLGTLLTASQYSEYIDGIILLAPFVGDESVLRDIEARGGAATWTPPAGTDAGAWTADNYTAKIWSWLRGYHSDPESRPPLYIGWGSEDRLGTADRLLANLMPEAHVFSQPGGHNWVTWRPLWRQVLSHAPVGQLVARPSAGPSAGGSR